MSLKIDEISGKKKVKRKVIDYLNMIHKHDLMCTCRKLQGGRGRECKKN